jgi:hypothetical protein
MPGVQCSSAKTTVEAAVRVSPVPAAVTERTATETSGSSWNRRTLSCRFAILVDCQPSAPHSKQQTPPQSRPPVRIASAIHWIGGWGVGGRGAYAVYADVGGALGAYASLEAVQNLFFSQSVSAAGHGRGQRASWSPHRQLSDQRSDGGRDALTASLSRNGGRWGLYSWAERPLDGAQI